LARVQKVFGASNVAKILNELSTSHREDAVNSLTDEADERLRGPVYGCAGLISVLKHRLKQVQVDLHSAKHELATYMGPSAIMPNLTQALMQQYVNMHPMLTDGWDWTGWNNGTGPGKTTNGTRRVVRTGLTKLCINNLAPSVGPNTRNYFEHYEDILPVIKDKVRHDKRKEVHTRLDFGDNTKRSRRIRESSQNSSTGTWSTTHRNPSEKPRQLNTTGFTPLTGPSNMAPSLALGGSYDNAMYQIQQEPQPQEDNPEPHLQQFIPQQLLVQQVQQPEPQPQTQPQMHPQEHNGDGGSEEGMSAAAQLVRLSDNEQS
ncbi:LOB domain-containing protein 36-like protein, partial [Tanacetum coccineum]